MRRWDGELPPGVTVHSRESSLDPRDWSVADAQSIQRRAKVASAYLPILCVQSSAHRSTQLLAFFGAQEEHQVASWDRMDEIVS